MFTTVIALALSLASDAAAPALLPRVPDGDLAAWVAAALQTDARNAGECSDALLLRNGRRPDRSIAAEVTSRLSAAGAYGLMVSSNEGAVVLRGRAVDEARRTRATALAQAVPGVRAVSNRLRVADGEPAFEPQGPPLPRAAEAPRQLAGLAFLTHDDLAGRGLVVEVRDGVALLSGEVNGSAAAAYAAGLASRVPGIRAVQSGFRVRAGTLEADRRLALLVHREISNDGLVQTVSNAITVTTRLGVLHLTGAVRDEAQRERAGQLAAGQPDAFGVVNELRIEPGLVLPPKGRIAGFRTWDDF